MKITDVSIDVDIAGGYQLRAMYGTKLATLSQQAAHLQIPSLHIAHRQSVGDTDGGRRGGGGAIVAELVPDDELAAAAGSDLGAAGAAGIVEEVDDRGAAGKGRRLRRARVPRVRLWSRHLQRRRGPR